MIEFKREGNDAVVVVDSGLGWTFRFKHTSEYESTAVLLQHRLADVFFKRMQAARKEAYERGWRDAKRKQLPKETYFSGRSPE